MKIYRTTDPTEEPITLDELKLALRVDAGSFSENIDNSQSLPPDSYAVADNYTTHVGDPVSVAEYSALVYLNAGQNGSGGTVDVKIQECDTEGGTYTDWVDGAFDQVTEANDDQIFEKEYTGSKNYIKTVAKVLVSASYFSTSILRRTATSIENDYLTEILTTAREHVESLTSRAILTQTWQYNLLTFPCSDRIKLPFGNLQSITSLTYTESDGTINTMVEGTDYLVEINGDQCGMIVLPYGLSWPSFTEYPSNPIKIIFVCGWTSSDDVPKKIKNAIKLIASDLYENRESQQYSMSGATYQDNPTLTRILASETLYDEF